MFQDISYEDELVVKYNYLKSLFLDLNIDESLIAQIVPSPCEYHYRHRLDMRLQKTRSSGILMGFTPKERRGLVEADCCPIANEAISDFLPELKKQAVEKIPQKYSQANLVVRRGQNDQVRWGGIGRHSLRMKPEDYFSTTIEGKVFYYSLETFFQANLSILPEVFKVIKSLPLWTGKVCLYDLYGGVGLFGIGLHDSVSKVVLVEEVAESIRIAKYNVEKNGLSNFDILEGKLENVFESIKGLDGFARHVAMIDPPRAGLSDVARKFLIEYQGFDDILYLSCHPESLKRDLAELLQEGFKVEKIMPFDFFPKTRHVETLVWMKKEAVGKR